MSGAQSWSVKGIDPKVREAAREAAARQGMSLGEYLNFALANQAPSAPTPAQAQIGMRTRNARFGAATSFDGDEDDWHLSGPTTLSRGGDPARLAQRIESIERRTQLAVTGLDRAVSTIDRSVLGLAARVEDAEAVSGESAERVAEALEHFQMAGETLGGRLERAEHESVESRRALDSAKSELFGVKERLETQVALAEEVARRAEAAASFLTTEMEQRDSALSQTLAEARAVAEEAARQAAEASADAVAELRHLQQRMSERLAETETSTRRAVETAIEDVRAETAQETRGAREALLEEVLRLEGEIAKRVGLIDSLKADQAGLIARIERAEAGSRESTAGLRQAAGAAIADLRNAQLTLAARVKQVEDSSGVTVAIDLSDVRQQQQDIAERLASLETKTESSPVNEAMAAFERRLADVEGVNPKFQEVDGAVRTLDQALQRLAERIAETESTANTAIRTLEETVSSLGARVEQAGAVQETEAVRAMLEQRLDTMAQSVHQMVGEARTELAGQLQAALEGQHGEGLEGALADVNRRLAAAERRQAQTIEAISLEIRRMSETVDKRLRAVEARNDDAAASAVREELSRMGTTLEQRFDDIERREAAAFDRMGLEVGRLSERLEDRVGAVEGRSAQAIEQVGEQVARMAERFNQRQEILARDLGERMLDSEERAGARVAEAIGSIMQRLAEVEEHSAEAIAPVQKAMSSVASKLERYESARDPDVEVDAIPTPSRRRNDFVDFGEPEEYVSPMEAAQPVRAGPISAPPRAPLDFDDDVADVDDIYFDEETEVPATAELAVSPEFKPFGSDDDLLIDDEEGDEPLAAAPENGDAFWAPDETQAAVDTALLPPEPQSAPDLLPEPILHFDEPPQPPGKFDYLANARKAAQAQSAPKTPAPKNRPDAPPAPRLSLRGSSRIVLWGAATVITALMVGGAWYLNGQAEAPTPRLEATPAAAPAPAADPNASFEAPPADPFAQAPAEGAPIAENGAVAPSSVVAGPLAPRNASLEQAAQSGDLTAQYELALQRLAAGRTPEGVSLLRRAADRGFAMAQYRLAKLYERGEGVPTDLAIARQWTERAAAAGNRRAMHDLGVYFARGEGAPLDEAAAFRWFRQAAELGVADSQYNLGVLYQQGRGVNASASEALFWFLVAARQGDQDASARATSLEAQLAAPQAAQARARSQAFRPRASSALANGEFGQRTYARTGT
jgi:localization factor PodJL